MPQHVETFVIKNVVLKQRTFFIVIFITNFILANCNWISVYVPKIDATCVLIVKKINHFEARYVEQLFCSFESCIATCFQHQCLCNSIKYTFFAKQCDLYNINGTYDSIPEDAETGQARHFLLHSCHKEISNVPVGNIIQSTSLNVDIITANVHLPSTHRVCRVQKRPFAESYKIQRLQLLTTSSLKRCLAACDAPSNSLCNSVLFSIQEKTCILLSRRHAFVSLGGSSATEDSEAQLFIILHCRNDFKELQFNATQSVRRQSAIAYTASNLHLQILIHHELFYASKAAIRLQLWDSSDDTECLKICLTSNRTDYCDAYYFSSREQTCLTMRLKKQYALPEQHGHQIITKFYDDETLNITLKDANEPYLKYAEHTIQMEISLHEFKEICVVQHWISTLIPYIRFNKHYANISFFNECINICRHLKNSDECKGIAYSKKMKTCMIAVEGNENDEILLSNDQHYLTLSSCIKDRETERTNNGQPEFCFLPQLNEMCLLEFYQPLCLSGWEVIARIKNTLSFQDCLLKCASVMYVKKCSAVNYIDQQCILLRRTEHAKFIRSPHSIFAEILFCARLIKSLFFIFHLFFTLESSPMHSYVYIPLFDKVCLIEKYIPQEYPTASRIPVFIYNSLESCIAACSNYMTRELLCNAFMYSDITKACHLHFYTVNIKKGMRPVETGQSQFYLLHRCFNRNNSLLNAAVNKKMKQTIKLRRLVSEINGAAGCNSVIFLLQEKSCTLVTHQSIFSTLSATLKSSAYFFEIDHCKTETLHYPLLTSLLLANATNPIQHFLSFGVRHLPITKSENAIIIDLLNCSTRQYCFYRCVMQRRDFGCNAVFFNAEEKTCLLMKLNVSSRETTDLVLYNFFKGYTRKEKLILSNYEDPLRFKTSFVSLHEFHERCQILTFTSAYAENLKVHSLLLQTNSLHSCLKVCRSNTNDTSCSGVLFSKHEKVCYKVVEGTFYDQIVTEDDQTIVLLQLCVKDREEERRENSMFYHYHLYELEEMCVFESYANHYFSGFAVYDNIPKSSSGYHCILKCASEQISKGCAAVHKSQERCMFFRRNSTARIFRKLENSYFAEMLYCESKCCFKATYLANCNWISVYVPKIDATCVLVVKKINHFEARYVEQLFCSFESCIATCFQHQCLCNSIKYTFFAKQCDLYNINGTYDSIPEDAETGQARHFLLHSCHKEISNVPVGNIIQSTSLNVDIITANVHLLSTHRVCRVQKRPFAESYKIQRLQLLTTSSLKRCLAACDAPSNSLCNSVLFSIQEKTCILLSRRQSFIPVEGRTSTVDSAARYFIILYCLSDFKASPFLATQSVRRQSVIAYTASNLPLQILIHYEPFYASKAAIRLQLWDSSDDTECLKICLTSNRRDYCDAYYFSSIEQTCLTMRLKKQYALPKQHGHQIITKFYDDETLNITLKDANEPYLKHPEYAIELEVSLHEFKEICIAQHWIATSMPNIRFSKHYANISFFNECINICRHLKNSDECKGIAYSKKMKTCMVAVKGNENDEILLSNDQHYLTLSSCIKDRETERTNNGQPEFCFLPQLNEMCLLEFYQPLCLSGWEVIARIKNTLSGCGSEIFTPKTGVVWSITIPSTPQTLSHNVVHERKEEEEGKRDIVVCYNEAKSGVDSFDNLVTLHICAGDGNIGGRWFCGSTFWIAKGCRNVASTHLILCAAPYAQIAIRQEILDKIDLFLMNTSFKSCISYSYSDFTLHNYTIFVYNEKARSCSVLYDIPEESMIDNCSEHLQDMQVYKVIHCLPAEGFTFMYSFEDEVEENVTRISAVKLKATAEICIVEKHPFSKNFLLKRSGMVFLQSLELCFAHCRVSSMRGSCSAVLFSSDERVCLLLQQNQPLQSTDVMRKSQSQFFTLNYCDYNITETTERRYYNGSGKITNITMNDRQLQCTVHEIPLLRVHMKHRSLLWRSINFQNCIQLCGQQFQTNLCNAVYFEAEGTTCLHLLLNSSQALYEYSTNNKETVHFIEKCVAVTVRPEPQEESVVCGNQSGEMRASPRSGERSSRTCNVRVQLLNIDVVRNAFTIHVSRKIYSLNRCLHICRKQNLCMAVLFSRLNHQCTKVFPGHSNTPIIVHAHVEVVALKGCFKDRPDERKYNSEPLIYYFEETQQICAVEIYKQKNLTSWECNAINYFQTKECLLIKSTKKNYIFTVKDDSIFAEVLYCELGTLVDTNCETI
ncbi:hypothetical protein T4C_10115 [Trichinella pseudospiralis]|uniref:Apple domain-containing protein n=1 Tax=Trichinella pseudospiralis TaxID=6337 RepID=A0A0V1K5A6_TRIPS|nr:hypothetical protein T4C_10115 [Trichinella pseudospiralis]